MNSTKPKHYVQLLDVQIWITVSFISYHRHAVVDFELGKGSNPICVSDLKMALAVCGLYNFLLLNTYWIHFLSVYYHFIQCIMLMIVYKF